MTIRLQALASVQDTYAINPCSALPRDSNLQDRDQCPEGTRACLTIVNQKSDEPDRIVSVVPVATGELDPKLAYAAASKGKPGQQALLHGDCSHIAAMLEMKLTSLASHICDALVHRHTFSSVARRQVQ